MGVVVFVLLLLAIVIKIVLTVRERAGRAKDRARGWGGHATVDNSTLYRSPSLRDCALREGKVVPRFGRTPRADGLAFGWLHVTDEIGFRPGRLTRGSGAKSFRLTADQLDDVRVEGERLSLRIRGEPETVELTVAEPAGLAEAVTQFRYSPPPAAPPP